MEGTVISGETPQRPQRAVRRNLLREFNDPNPVCRTPDQELDLNTPVMDATPIQNVEYSEGWGNLLKFWICVVLLCVVVGVSVYHLFPGQLLVWITREFIFVSVTIVLCAVVLSLIWKFIRMSGRNRREYAQPFANTVLGGSTPQSTANDGVYTSRVHSQLQSFNIPVKRTFSGDGSTIWSEFIRYFENVSNLNQWTVERMRRVLLTTLRDQAETYAYGLPENTLSDYKLLKDALNQRFGHTALKESYIAEAKLRRKKEKETFRDFGQAIEDLYRRAHTGNAEAIEENSLKTFLDNCSDNEDFRLAVKRTRPKTVQDAVTAAMQEECIKVGETEATKPVKVPKRDIYSVQTAAERREQSNNQRISSGRPPLNNTRRCYSCGSESHLRNRCPNIVSRSSANAQRGSNGPSTRGNGPPPRQ